MSPLLLVGLALAAPELQPTAGLGVSVATAPGRLVFGIEAELGLFYAGFGPVFRYSLENLRWSRLTLAGAVWVPAGNLVVGGELGWSLAPGRAPGPDGLFLGLDYGGFLGPDSPEDAPLLSSASLLAAQRLSVGVILEAESAQLALGLGPRLPLQLP